MNPIFVPLASMFVSLSSGQLSGAPAQPAPAEGAIFESGVGLAPGWMDWGWSPHELPRTGAARLDLSNYGGLILARQGFATDAFRALTFEIRAPEAFGDFLEVRLETASGQRLARVRPGRARGEKLADGSLRFTLPMSELNPDGETFERVVFHAWRTVSNQRVELDHVRLLAADPTAQAPRQSRGERFVVDCRAAGHAISPLIYGIGGSDDAPHQWAVFPTARRWGGNAASRFNWELGNAWSTSSDWYFRNFQVRDRPNFSVRTWLEENRAHGVKSALTVPMLGWVAKDTRSFSFPRSVFGAQQSFDPNLPEAGNGLGLDGKPIAPGPPTMTSVRSTPESIERWVRTLRAADGEQGRSVDEYILDNEPMLWHQTHRDVHPEPATYDELLEKTIAYASAIRRADPQACIAGPASWGWLGYHYSAKDVASGVRLRPDRRAHGDVPLIPWYLKKLREYREKTGIRLIDVLDVHFYPGGQDVAGPNGDTGRKTAALRIRSTRSLWDPTYRDESWIDERMRVLPLLRQWVQENDPGLGISIGEWNFGAERHMSGGLATAEALGRFGTEGITSAFYWNFPEANSPAFWAFRAYRNYDGAGAQFLNWSIPVQSAASLASLFASRDEARSRIVAVLLNFDPSVTLAAGVDLTTCGQATSTRAFTYAGGEAGLKPLLALEPKPGALEVDVAPYSMTVIEVGLAGPGPEARPPGAR